MARRSPLTARTVAPKRSPPPPQRARRRGRSGQRCRPRRPRHPSGRRQSPLRPRRRDRALVAALARRPRTVARRTARLGAELSAIAAGSSDQAPQRADRRFADPAWRGNWMLRRLLQGYLAFGETAQQLIDDAELDWASDHRVRFLAENLHDALAPTNFPLTNPAALKATIDRGGANFVDRRRAVRAGRALAGEDPGQRRHDAVQGRRDAGDDAGGRRAPRAPIRAAPVPAQHRTGARGAARDRPADDQQVLRGRSLAGPQPRRVPRRSGPAGVLDLVAQSRPASRRLGPRQLRRGDPRGAGDGPPGDRRGPGARRSASVPGASPPRARSGASRRSASSTRSPG